MKQSSKWGFVVAVLALVALVAVFAAASPASGAQQRQRFDWVIADRLTVLDGSLETYSGATLAGGVHVYDTAYFNGVVSAADALYVSGEASVGGELTTLGDVTMAQGLGLSGVLNMGDVTYELTGTQTLTPTASYYVISPTAAVTVTLGDGSGGDWLVLTNITSNDAVIADSNVRTATGGAITLGQYDVCTLLFTGVEWFLVSLSANS